VDTNESCWRQSEIADDELVIIALVGPAGRTEGKSSLRWEVVRGTRLVRKAAVQLCYLRWRPFGR